MRLHDGWSTGYIVVILLSTSCVTWKPRVCEHILHATDGSRYNKDLFGSAAAGSYADANMDLGLCVFNGDAFVVPASLYPRQGVVVAS